MVPLLSSACAVCCPAMTAGPCVVARRRALPDLPALLRGLRRRRDRRSARDPGAPGLSRVARDRRHLAQPDDAVAQRRLGLRRRRLLRRASRPGHAGGPRRARRGRRRARDQGAARPRPEPHQRRARVVRRRASGREARHRDYYVWADPAPDGGPPNNWRRTSAAPRGSCTSRPASTT